ncbi:hypothetical protein ACIA8G_21490 [Lentzea sp. NPDC051213]|uniref:hypothetical protein n=1 Tax=Lentzea sp. NPDC051213 TaxID=3364126 RepID=UPI0037991799
MTEESDKTSAGVADAPEADALATDVAGIVNSALNIVTGLVKTTAEMTERDRLIAPPNADTPALNAIIHYGLTTMVNIAGLVTSALRDNTETAKSQPDDGPTTAEQNGLPTLPPGATLRMPLSVENRGETIMTDVVPQLVKLDYVGHSPTSSLDASAVRFEPEQLSIGARDFEKVKVIVAAPQDAATGTYALTVALGEEVTTMIRFVVAL